MFVKIDREKLQKYINQYPDATYQQIADAIGCSLSGVYFALRNSFSIKRRGAYDDEILRIISENPSATYAEIASEINKSASYVHSRLIALGLRSAGRGKTKRERILEYAKSHPSATNLAIAQSVGCTSITVARTLIVAGLRQPRGRIDDEVLLQKLEENPNVSNRELADFFGCTPSSVSFAKRRAKGMTSPKKSFPARSVKWEEISPLIDGKPDVSATELARALQTSVSVVWRLLHEHGIETSPKRKIDREELVRILNENPDTSYTALAKRFGCSKQAVQDYCRRIGIARPRHILSNVPAEDILAYVSEHPDKSYSEIGRILGVSTSAVRSCAIRAGINRNEFFEKKKAGFLDYARAHPNTRLSDLADLFGFSVGFVSNLLVKNGIREKNTFHVDTEAVIATIKDNLKRTRASLAEEFHCSAATISRIKSIMRGTLAQRPTKARDTRVAWEEIEALLLEDPDMSVVDISKRLNASSSTIFRLLRKHGKLRGHKKKVSFDDVQKLLAEGKDVYKIAVELGVCPTTVRNAIARGK